MPLDVDQNRVDQGWHDKPLSSPVNEKHWREVEAGEVGAARCGGPQQAYQTRNHEPNAKIDNPAAQLRLHANRCQRTAEKCNCKPQERKARMPRSVAKPVLKKNCRNQKECRCSAEETNAAA